MGRQQGLVLSLLRQLVPRQLGWRQRVLDRCLAGALTSFGLGSAFGVTNTALGVGSFGYPTAGFGIYDAFPTWSASEYTDWGLGSVASDWMYSGYANPYASTLVATQPATSTVVFDYSQPINLVAAAPEPSVATSTEQIFSAARDAFHEGNYRGRSNWPIK